MSDSRLLLGADAGAITREQTNSMIRLTTD